jgi:uridine kinase
MIVAVGGASCSGKSTLTNWLSILLKSPIVHQDQFYKTDKEIPQENGIYNWDSTDAIDFIKFTKCISDVRKGITVETMMGPNRPLMDETEISERKEEIDSLTKSILNLEKITLVDGFLLYSDPSHFDIYDIKLFLSSPKNILRERRNTRKDYITLGILILIKKARGRIHQIILMM